MGRSGGIERSGEWMRRAVSARCRGNGCLGNVSQPVLTWGWLAIIPNGWWSQKCRRVTKTALDHRNGVGSQKRRWVAQIWRWAGGHINGVGSRRDGVGSVVGPHRLDQHARHLGPHRRELLPAASIQRRLNANPTPNPTPSWDWRCLNCMGIGWRWR